VAEPDAGEQLHRRRSLAVVVRLVVDCTGELTHGEIVDELGHACARFADWEALVPAMRAWLEREGKS
jgi:hypothetical protein